jgi:hypothetical protein
VTEISYYIQTPDVVTADVLTAELWRARQGAFSPRSAFPGTGVPAVGSVVSGSVVSGRVTSGSTPCVVVRQVPRVPGKAVLAIPAPQSAGSAQLGHVNNYMTSVFAGGEGASGPPPYREPA